MSATALLCFVIAITDGDTLLASCDHKQTVIRIAEIDAPEKRQDFGLRARQSLVELCLNKEAIINPLNIDRFGRTVAYVNCVGKEAHTEQVKRGMAWVSDLHVINESLYDLQSQAQSSKIGLWKHQSPTPPWEWRKTQLAPKR
mgnify:CR=1 FL=1